MDTNRPAEQPILTRSAIILCGGKSLRMGRDKSAMPFGAGQTMLGQVMTTAVQLVSTENIACVCAKDQVLPPVAQDISIVHDRVSDAGPLAGLAAGLTAAGHRAASSFVFTCDTPLVRAEFLEHLFLQLDNAVDVVVPREGSRIYPLTAVYRTALAPIVNRHLDAGMRRMSDLIGLLRAKFVSAEELRSIDPTLQSLLNCNEPSDYERALALANRAQ